jgi:hypothetical protein
LRISNPEQFMELSSLFRNALLPARSCRVRPQLHLMADPLDRRPIVLVPSPALPSSWHRKEPMPSELEQGSDQVSSF